MGFRMEEEIEDEEQLEEEEEEDIVEVVDKYDLVKASPSLPVPYQKPVNEEKLLREIVKDCKEFDHAFGRYSKDALHVLRPTLLGKAYRAVASLLSEDEHDGLSVHYDGMMESMDGVVTNLGMLAKVHHHASKGVEDLVRYRLHEGLSTVEAQEYLRGKIARARSLHEQSLNALSNTNLSQTQKMKFRVYEAGTDMELSKARAFLAQLDRKSSYVERSIDELRATYARQTSTVASYQGMLDLARTMVTDLQLTGPADITAVYLARGAELLRDRLGRIESYHQELKADIEERVASMRGSLVQESKKPRHKNISGSSSLVDYVKENF